MRDIVANKSTISAIYLVCAVGTRLARVRDVVFSHLANKYLLASISMSSFVFTGR